MSGHLKKLLANLEELNDDTDNVATFQDFDPDDIKAVTGAATLVEYKGAQYWLPFSQLRKLDDQILASDWILKQKGIEV